MGAGVEAAAPIKILHLVYTGKETKAVFWALTGKLRSGVICPGIGLNLLCQWIDDICSLFIQQILTEHYHMLGFELSAWSERWRKHGLWLQ